MLRVPDTRVPVFGYWASPFLIHLQLLFTEKIKTDNWRGGGGLTPLLHSKILGAPS